MTQTTDRPVGVYTPAELIRLEDIKNSIPELQGMNVEAFRNRLIKDTSYLDQISGRIAKLNVDDGIVDFSTFKTNEEKQKAAADYTGRVRSDLGKLATMAAMDGPTFTQAMIGKKRELGVYKSLGQTQASNYITTIHENAARYPEFFSSDGKTPLIKMDEQGILQLKTKLASDASLIEKLESDNIARFQSELAKKHNIGAGGFTNAQMAEAYAIFDSMGSEGLTNYVNLNTKEERDRDGNVTPTQARAEYLRLKNGKQLYSKTEIIQGQRYNNKKLMENPFAADIRTVAGEVGIDPTLLAALIKQESNFNPEAVSPVGAYGLTQFMPGTFGDLVRPDTSLGKSYQQLYGEAPRDLKELSDDPVKSIRAGAVYLKTLLDTYNGDVEKALAAYNWGAGNVNKAVKTYGDGWKEALPAETSDYITRIPGYMKDGGEIVSGPVEERVVVGESSALDYAARMRQATFETQPGDSVNLDIDPQFNAFSSYFFKQEDQKIRRADPVDNYKAFSRLYSMVNANPAGLDEAYGAFQSGATNSSYTAFLVKLYNDTSTGKLPFTIEDVRNTMLHEQQYRKYVELDAFNINTGDPLVRLSHDILRLSPDERRYTRYDEEQKRLVYVTDHAGANEKIKESRLVMNAINDWLKEERIVWSDEAGGLVKRNSVGGDLISSVVDGTAQLIEGTKNGVFDSVSPVIRLLQTHSRRAMGYSDREIEAIYQNVRDRFENQFFGDDRSNVGAMSGTVGYLGGFIGGIAASGGYGTWALLGKTATKSVVNAAMNSGSAAKTLQSAGRWAELVKSPTKLKAAIAEGMAMASAEAAHVGGKLVFGTIPHSALSSKYDPTLSMFNTPLIDHLVLDSDRPIGDVQEFYLSQDIVGKMAMDVGADLIMNLLFDGAFSGRFYTNLAGTDTAKVLRLFGRDGDAIFRDAMFGKPGAEAFDVAGRGLPEFLRERAPLVLEELRAELAKARQAGDSVDPNMPRPNPVRSMVENFGKAMDNDFESYTETMLREFDEQMMAARGSKLTQDQLDEIKSTFTERLARFRSGFYDRVAENIVEDFSANKHPNLALELADDLYAYNPGAWKVLSGVSYLEAADYVAGGPNKYMMVRNGDAYDVYGSGDVDFVINLADAIRRRVYNKTSEEYWKESAAVLGDDPTLKAVHDSMFGMKLNTDEGGELRFLNYTMGETRYIDPATNKVGSKKEYLINAFNPTTGKIEQVRPGKVRLDYAEPIGPKDINPLEREKLKLKKEIEEGNALLEKIQTGQMSENDMVEWAFAGKSKKEIEGVKKGLASKNEKTRVRSQERLQKQLAKKAAEFEKSREGIVTRLRELEPEQEPTRLLPEVSGGPSKEVMRVLNVQDMIDRLAQVRDQLRGLSLMQLQLQGKFGRVKSISDAASKRGPEKVYNSKTDEVVEEADLVEGTKKLTDEVKAQLDKNAEEIEALRAEEEQLRNDLNIYHAETGDVSTFVEGELKKLSAGMEMDDAGKAAISVGESLGRVRSIWSFLNPVQKAEISEKLSTRLGLGRLRSQRKVLEQTITTLREKITEIEVMREEINKSGKKLDAKANKQTAKMIAEMQTSINDSLNQINVLIRDEAKLTAQWRQATTDLPFEQEAAENFEIVEQLVEMYGRPGSVDPSWRAGQFSAERGDALKSEQYRRDLLLRAAILKEQMRFINEATPRKEYSFKTRVWKGIPALARRIAAVNIGLESMDMLAALVGDGKKRMLVGNSPEVPIKLYTPGKEVPANTAVFAIDGDGQLGVYVARQKVPAEGGLRPTQFVTGDMGEVRMNPYWGRLGVNVMVNSDGGHKVFGMVKTQDGSVYFVEKPATGQVVLGSGEVHLNIQRPVQYDSTKESLEDFKQRVINNDLGDAIVVNRETGTEIIPLSVDQLFDTASAGKKKTPQKFEDYEGTGVIEKNGVDLTKVGPPTLVALAFASAIPQIESDSDLTLAGPGVVAAALMASMAGGSLKSIRGIGNKFRKNVTSKVQESFTAYTAKTTMAPASKALVNDIGKATGKADVDKGIKASIAEAARAGGRKIHNSWAMNSFFTRHGALAQRLRGSESMKNFVDFVKAIEALPIEINGRFASAVQKATGLSPNEFWSENVPLIMEKVIGEVRYMGQSFGEIYNANLERGIPLDVGMQSPRNVDPSKVIRTIPGLEQAEIRSRLGDYTPEFKAGMQNLVGQYISFRLQGKSHAGVKSFLEKNPVMVEVFRKMDEVPELVAFADAMKNTFAEMPGRYRSAMLGNMVRIIKVWQGGPNTRLFDLMNEMIASGRKYTEWKKGLSEDDKAYLSRMRKDAYMGEELERVISANNHLAEFGNGIGNYLPNIIDRSKLNLLIESFATEELAGDAGLLWKDAENRGIARVVDAILELNGKKEGKPGIIGYYDTETAEIVDSKFVGSSHNSKNPSIESAKENAVNYLHRLMGMMSDVSRQELMNKIGGSGKIYETFVREERVPKLRKDGSVYEEVTYTLQDPHGQLSRMAEKISLESMIHNMRREGLNVRKSHYLDILRRYEIPAELQWTDMPKLMDSYSTDVGMRIANLEHGVFDEVDFERQYVFPMMEEYEKVLRRDDPNSAQAVEDLKAETEALYKAASGQDPWMKATTDKERLAYIQNKDRWNKVTNIIMSFFTGSLYPIKFTLLDVMAPLVQGIFLQGNRNTIKTIFGSEYVEGTSYKELGRELLTGFNMIGDTIASINPTIDDAMLGGTDFLTRMNRVAARYRDFMTTKFSGVRFAETMMSKMTGDAGYRFENLRRYNLPLMNSFMDINNNNKGLFVGVAMADVMSLKQAYRQLKNSGESMLEFDGKQVNVGSIRRQLELHGLKFDNEQQLDRFFRDQDVYRTAYERVKATSTGRVDIANLDTAKHTDGSPMFTAEEIEAINRAKMDNVRIMNEAMNSFHAKSPLNQIPYAKTNLGRILYQFTSYPVNLALEGLKRRIVFPFDEFKTKYDGLGDFNVFEVYTMVTNGDKSRIGDLLKTLGRPADAASVKQFIEDYPVEAVYQILRIPQFLMGTTGIFVGRDAAEDLMMLPFVDDKDQWLRLRQNMIVNRFAPKEQQVTFGELFDKPALEVAANLIPRIIYETGRSGLFGVYPNLLESMNYAKNPLEMIPMVRPITDVYTGLFSKGLKNLIYSPQDIDEFPSAALELGMEYAPISMTSHMKSMADDWAKAVVGDSGTEYTSSR